MIKKKISICLALTMTVSSGCSVPRLRHTPQYTSHIRETKTIAVMPPDLYLHQITAGKQIELMDEWTEDAKERISSALKENLSDRYGYEVKFIEEDWLKENHNELWKDYKALYAAVVENIMLHAMGHGPHQFPTKENTFDYTLGEGVSELADIVGADMLLFIYGEEYYSTKGKMVSEIFVFAALAVLSGGTAVAFPMLVPDKIYFGIVNGENGQVEWVKSLSTGILTRSLNDKKSVSKVIKSVTEDMLP